MSRDRELLEMAAKAAGIVLDRWNDGNEPYSSGEGFILAGSGVRFWNPITRNGDALQLSVLCGLAVMPYPIYGRRRHSVIVKRYEENLAAYRGDVRQIEVVEVYGCDADAATRRAIVRAAAEIARNTNAS